MKTLKIIKIGGNIIDDEIALVKFLSDFATLKGPKLLVHGGGKLATKLAQSIGLEVKMVDGRRITDADTLDVITMVYAGKINKSIVAQLQEYNCNCIGFTGADGNTIRSVKRPPNPIDFGFVGDVNQVDTSVLKILIDSNITPVFCAITHDENGQLLNTNADTIASELAKALTMDFEVELYYCFEKKGVLMDISNENSVIEKITQSSFENLVAKGIISDGMLPKLTNCLSSVKYGVSKVCIGKPEMLFKEKSTFTTITND